MWGNTQISLHNIQISHSITLFSAPFLRYYRTYCIYYGIVSQEYLAIFIHHFFDLKSLYSIYYYIPYVLLSSMYYYISVILLYSFYCFCMYYCISVYILYSITTRVVILNIKVVYILYNIYI